MRIARIVCDGFKSGPPQYDLGPATLLIGPNGSGKSRCLEGLRYALSGEIPAGKSLDTIARYTGPEGGVVNVYDIEGHWIQRGISINAELKKVSEILTTSDTQHGATEPDLSRWAASPAVLDLGAFLGLSPNLRREYILKLCGSSGPAAGLFEALELEYAREGLGKIATAAMLSFDAHGRTDDGHPDLPKEEHDVILSWIEPRGIREIVRSYLVAGASVTEQCLLLADGAKEQRLGHGRGAKEAKAALKELESAAKGARAASHDIKALRAAVVAAQEAHAAGAFHHGKVDGARRNFAAARADLARWEQMARAIIEMPDPGPRPEVKASGLDAQRYTLAAEVAKCKGLLGEAEEAIRMLDLDDAIITRIGVDIDRLRAEHKAARSSPIGQALELLAAVPSGLHANIEALRPILEELGAETTRRIASIAERGKAAQATAAAVRAKRPNIGEERSALALVVKDRLAAVDAAQVALAALKAKPASDAALKAWEAANASRQAALTDRAKDAQALEDSRRALSAATDALEDLEAEPVRPLTELSERVAQASQALEQAERASGAVQAYEDAIARCAEHQRLEGAWKILELAIKVVRERLVGAATKPLLATLATILEGAGRKERVYLDLENERGKPIFELGWTRGEARIALEALSGGEAAIFAAALSVAIALESPGLKIVCIEADALDEVNLLMLLGTVGPWGPRLDALLVASHRAPDVIEAGLWLEIDLGAQTKPTVAAGK